MELLNFIKNNEDWQTLLQKPPYSIGIKEDDSYYILKYSQFESDFSLPLVRECRGIILRKSDFKVVCYPFDKFFNAPEVHSAKIDWSSAAVQEKLDGSIIKVWYDLDTWHISTNGTIDAYNSKLNDVRFSTKSYGELFEMALRHRFDQIEQEFWQKLNKNYTYMFELCSPYSRVVVSYPITKLFLIGIRDNRSFLEIKPEDDELGKILPLPKKYPLQSLDECLLATQKMSFSEEGFVVVDKNFNRIKIKSPAYVAAHYLKNNSIQTTSRILNIILGNEKGEFLSYFPEFSKEIERVEVALNKLLAILSNQIALARTMCFDSRKDYALWVNANCIHSNYMFLAKGLDFDYPPLEWFKGLTEAKKEQYIDEFLRGNHEI